MATLAVHSVLGSVSAGKSTFIGQTWSPDDAVIMRIGSMLRAAIGTTAMAKEASPNAPALTEDFARSCVEQGYLLAVRLNRPLVLDGFPRTTEQAKWVMKVMFAPEGWILKQPVHYSAHVLTVCDAEVRSRVEASNKGKEFDLLRLEQSLRDVERVLDVIRAREIVVRRRTGERKFKFQRKIQIQFHNQPHKAEGIRLCR